MNAETVLGGTDLAIRLLVLLNDYRQKRGKNPVLLSQRLSHIALEHTVAMVEGRVAYGHDGYQTRRALIGAEHALEACGENVARAVGQADPLRALFAACANTPSGRQNLVDDWTHVGLAFASRDDTWYHTQLLCRFDKSVAAT